MYANSIVMAVHKSGLRTSTSHIIQKDRSCSLAKTLVYVTYSDCSYVESVEEILNEPLTNRIHMHVKQTCWKESNLPANYVSISTSPVIMTNGAPLVAVADLNPTLTRVCTTLESDVSICTPCQ